MQTAIYYQLLILFKRWIEFVYIGGESFDINATAPL